MMIREGKRRLLSLTTIFTIVAIVSLAVELTLPKRWDASALIVVEGAGVIKPLMEGRAVATTADETALVTQVVLGRKILRELATKVHLFPARTSPQDQERLLGQFKGRIKIETPREETLRISYSDTDPQRAARTTNLIAQTYVSESAALKQGQSAEAFAFIDKRVKEYGAKLTEAHQKLLDYYRGEGARSTSAPHASTAPVSPTSHVSAEQLASLRVEEATLMAQLGRKPAAAAVSDDARNLEQYRARVAQAQSELDRLAATFTDEHPDVRRAKRDLATAKEELRRGEQARADLDRERAAATALDDDVVQASRARLEEVQRQIAAATGVRARPIASRPVSAETMDPEMRGVGQDTTQSELFRVYESTRDVYQDLLKRRENARVSMDLDVEHSGLDLRIEEEAEVPVMASSVRFVYLAAIGLVLAVGIPLGLLVMIVRFDPRVRSSQQIERLANVPLLVSIPYNPARDRSRYNNRDVAVMLMLASVFLVYVVTFVIKLKMSS